MLNGAQGPQNQISAKGIRALEADAIADFSFAHQVPTAKEKEFRELARKIREQDRAFDKEWKTAKATDRLRLRTERMEKLQPTLARLNVLSRQIAKERSEGRRSRPEPVAVSGIPTPQEEIRGKSELELSQLGIAVKALHQKKDPEPEPDSAERIHGSSADK
jgi:hypothetical protein